MKMIYNPGLKAHLSLDKKNKVRHILHTQKYFLSEKTNARLATIDYLQKMAETFKIPLTQLKNLHQKVSFLDPREQSIEYRLYEVKKFFAAATYCYYQTIHNVPVWHGGMTVTVKENPFRIIHADHYGHDDLEVDLPPKDVIEKIRAELIKINSVAQAAQVVRAAGEEAAEPPIVSLKKVFPSSGPMKAAKKEEAKTPPWFDRLRIKRGNFYIYRYEAKERQPEQAEPQKKAAKAHGPEVADYAPTLPLPPVPDPIKQGRHYLVAEIVFNVEGSARPRLNWKALVEVETGSILWLRVMTAGVNGLVFTYDPKTSTGDLTNTADKDNTVFNPLRDDIELLNLDAPVAGTQNLTGSHVTVVEAELPTVVVPTETAGTDFTDTDKYAARTNDFAAVNAYYHANNVFDVIEDIGFSLATYFDGTTFPVHVDHRGSALTTDGIEVNAHCDGDAGGTSGDGIGIVGFCLSDTTDTTHPLGRSVDKWVHWHEIGGHGILYDHVSGPNFGFCHSAGDSLAAFQNDPESLLRTKTQRFQYAPFRDWPTGSDRWFNRTVADDWGWDGPNDDNGYKTEQILATVLFRVYQALGGDANDVAKRWHASRVATYLVLNAVGHCSTVDNPASPLAFYNKLVAADADDWTHDGLAGGAYNKVILWSFEKQGLWRAAGAPTTDPGEPPAVDLYIDDGRGGEYQYQAVHWENPSVWNRQVADDLETQDPGNPGVPNFAYVKVKNRGTTDANGVVKVYHCKPGAGLTWPTDFEQAEPLAGLPTGNVLANSGNEVKIGPFTWTPNANMYGHDCLLAIVTADGDPSNVDNLEAGQTIQEWRLVPHDNNVGQRNVPLLPGGEGGEALAAALDGAFFFAGNNFNKPAQMELRVDVPKIMAAKGWRLHFAGIEDNKFWLKAGEKRRIVLKLVKGAEFTADEIRRAGPTTFTVHLYANGMLMGGMSYNVHPDIKKAPHRPESRCLDAAQGLLDCLKLSGGRKVKKVRVKKVSVDLEFDSDCGCD